MCETNDNDCVRHQCKNGATCVDLVNDYRCNCPYGFKGAMCEIDQDLCADLKPCKNGARCDKLKQDYQCNCPIGFTNKNCSTNIDDCTDNICQNGAHCIDGVGGYSCECAIGFSGKYCTIKTRQLAEYVSSSVCQNSDCQNNGVCFQPPGSSEYVCRCPSGYEGKKCEKLQSVKFVQDSFVQSPGLNFSALYNITMVFTTSEDNGLLLYQGRNSHIAAELYYGRVRVSFSPDDGQYNNLLVYSYATVNNSQSHTLSIVVDGTQMSMYLDNAEPLTISSSGDSKYIKSTSNMYIGGLPKELRHRAKNRFQTVTTNSFQGCVHAMFFNSKLFDFDSVNLRNNNLLPGCASKMSASNACDGNSCVNGKCISNQEAKEYTCECDKDYTGRFCDQRKASCVATTYKDHYTDPETGCKSKGKLKLKRCEGSPSCTVKRTRKKTVKMECADKRAYTKQIEVPRKCSRSKRRRL